MSKMDQARAMWNERFSQSDYQYGEAANDFIRENVSAIPKGKVLCLAEGEGRNAVFLAAQGYDVTAVDLSAAGLVKAKALADKHGVSLTLIEADLATFDLGEQQWQGIVGVWCHLPSAIRKDLYQRITPALAPGGVFISEVYTPDQLQYGTGGPKDVDMLVTATELKSLFPLLTFEHCEEKVRHITEGALHNGDSAVVQCIARRS